MNFQILLNYHRQGSKLSSLITNMSLTLHVFFPLFYGKQFVFINRTVCVFLLVMIEKKSQNYYRVILNGYFLPLSSGKSDNNWSITWSCSLKTASTIMENLPTDTSLIHNPKLLPIQIAISHKCENGYQNTHNFKVFVNNM